ncbi:MAG: hypothetical protein U0798_06825 [Gemmataceae bacterium]
MGQINLIHDESWRAARLVVNHFEARLEDDELTESFHVVREIVVEAMRRFLERHEREMHRLAKKEVKCHV